MKSLVTLAQAIFDIYRLQIIKLLQIREMCVCELAESLGLSSPRMSQHLAILRRANVVQERREGKWIYYALIPKTLEEFNHAWNRLLEQPINSVTDMKPVWKRLNSIDLEQVKQACANVQKKTSLSKRKKAD
ncbi:MAG TPA: metalloregulator ArsR/SmtB family transcription factor [Bacillota bacterium]|jgi:ArsR family transcriptional regulator|nr:metalloregulator ArsR/SmtB family transcription factor [Bacillota bacterium]